MERCGEGTGSLNVNVDEMDTVCIIFKRDLCGEGTEIEVKTLKRGGNAWWVSEF